MAQVKSVMAAELVMVSEQTPVYVAMRILFQYNVTGLPVVRDGMQIIGIITDLDLLNTLDAPPGNESTVGDYMTKEVIACAEEDDLRDVCRKMAAHNIRHLPVASGGVLTGLVSRQDILRYILQQHDAV